MVFIAEYGRFFPVPSPPGAAGRTLPPAGECFLCQARAKGTLSAPFDST